MKITWIKKDGKLELYHDDKIRYARFINRTEDWEIIEIELWKVKFARSIQQNRFYFGVVVKPLAEYIGIESIDTMHETLKALHLTQRIRVAYDRRRKMTINTTTTELDTMQFEEYLEKIRIWAKKFLNFRIPYPNEVPEYAYTLEEMQ